MPRKLNRKDPSHYSARISTREGMNSSSLQHGKAAAPRAKEVPGNLHPLNWSQMKKDQER